MSDLRRVLLLGSGLTVSPLIECLTRDGTVAVTVGKGEMNKEGRMEREERERGRNVEKGRGIWRRKVV